MEKERRTTQTLSGRMHAKLLFFFFSLHSLFPHSLIVFLPSRSFTLTSSLVHSFSLTMASHHSSATPHSSRSPLPLSFASWFRDVVFVVVLIASHPPPCLPLFVAPVTTPILFSFCGWKLLCFLQTHSPWVRVLPYVLFLSLKYDNYGLLSLLVEEFKRTPCKIEAGL